jgi:hypothetical protein
MLSAAPLAAPGRPPIVRPVSTLIGESAAVRATISGLVRGRVYRVRFRVTGATGAVGAGCVASVDQHVIASSHGVRVGLAPRGIWCPGAGVLSVAAIRRGSPTGRSAVHVGSSMALGRGNVVGHLLLGPTCPVERLNDPCDPVARPDPVSLVALTAGGAEAARTVTLADGSFALDLPAGSYTLHSDQTRTSFPSIADVPLLVSAGATRSNPVRVVVTGDTGIR